MNNSNMPKDRAWIEIDLKNFENNIEQIKNILPQKTKIMAVVKANAYGHQMVDVSKKLNEMGIKDFAVATLQEGITLRENNIKGNILILGYTSFEDIKYVKKYDLIQTIVDYEYAKKINDILNEKIKAHVKINTGMNRIGESYKNIDNLSKIFQMNNLEILGSFTHLCVSDSLTEENIEYTKKQISNFYECIEDLKKLGFNPGKLHILNSYGILNYSDVECDYARPGIIMYGVHSEYKIKTKLPISLKPVLFLKSRITSIRDIEKGESVGYGRDFIASKNTKIASVSIGYADGYPRNLSNKHAKVMVNGKYAEVIGKICMDQLMIDVSDIEDIKQGDVVTLIGDKEEISAEKLALQCDSVSYELLARLSNRLGVIIKK